MISLGQKEIYKKCGPNLFCSADCGLVDSQTCTRNNFLAGKLCSFVILHVQQLSNKPTTATGVVLKC